MSKKKITELVADIPLRSTTKVYYVRMENGMPGDQGWVTVDEAKRMNATDRRTHGQPMNRYFQDQQSAETFVTNPPAGGPPSDAMPPAEAPMDDMGMGAEPPLGEEPVDDFGAGLPDEGMGGMPGDDLGMDDLDTGIGEEPIDDFGDGLDDMGMDDMGGLGGEEDALGDLGGDDLLGDLDAEEEADFELVVPRRVRLVPAKESIDKAESFADLLEGCVPPQFKSKMDNKAAKKKRKKKKEGEETEPAPTNEATTCRHCGAGVQNNVCSVCRRLQGPQPKADYRDEPHNGTKKYRKRDESTEAGVIEALLGGDCTIEEAIEEQVMGTPGQVAYSQRDQGILGKQVAAHTQTKAPQMQWDQQPTGQQLTPELQQLLDQYMAAQQANDPSAPQLKQQLVFELQVAGIDPSTVIR